MYIDANVEEEKIIVPSLNKCQFMSSLSQFGILFRKIQRISNDRDKKSLTNLFGTVMPRSVMLRRRMLVKIDESEVLITPLREKSADQMEMLSWDFFHLAIYEL